MDATSTAAAICVSTSTSTSTSTTSGSSGDSGSNGPVDTQPADTANNQPALPQISKDQNGSGDHDGHSHDHDLADEDEDQDAEMLPPPPPPPLPPLEDDALSNAILSTLPRAIAQRRRPAVAATGGGVTANGTGTDDLGFATLEALRARLSELPDLTPEEQETLHDQETYMQEAVREIADVVIANAPDRDKVEFVQSRFMELVQELSDTDLLLSRATRNLDAALKERDAAQAEINKLGLMKTRLESLCRELQKENKRIKDESRLMIQAEQAKREELSAQFQKAITEIKAKMEDGEQKLRKAQDSEVMREQLRNIVEQYNLREQHFNSILRSKDLEVKLYEAKLVQQTELAIQEHQKSLAYKQQHEVSTQRETELRQQLETYADKFEQVQDAINKSNEVFNAFKREMEQMTKKLRKMEKENESLKGKCEGMSKNIAELQDERTKTLKTLDAQKSQKTKLESLCRALHQECRELTSKLDRYTRRLEVAEGGPVTDTIDAASAPTAATAAAESIDDVLAKTEEPSPHDMSVSVS